MSLNVKEACAAIPCCESMLRKMMHNGNLPKGVYYRVGRRIFFNSDKLDEWKAKGGSVQFDESA